MLLYVILILGDQIYTFLTIEELLLQNWKDKDNIYKTPTIERQKLWISLFFLIILSLYYELRKKTQDLSHFKLMVFYVFISN